MLSASEGNPGKVAREGAGVFIKIVSGWEQILELASGLHFPNPACALPPPPPKPTDFISLEMSLG